jgi:ketosteroid isomerase-like protein
MIGTLLAKRGIAAAFGALNRHDLEAFMSTWRDDAVFIFPGDIPESGRFEGKSAIAAWFQRYFEQFPEIRYEIEDICVRNCFDFSGNNVLAVQWTLQLKNREGRAGTNSGITVVTVQGGNVITVKDLYFDTGAEFRRDWGVV